MRSRFHLLSFFVFTLKRRSRFDEPHRLIKRPASNRRQSFFKKLDQIDCPRDFLAIPVRASFDTEGPVVAMFAPFAVAIRAVNFDRLFVRS